MNESSLIAGETRFVFFVLTAAFLDQRKVAEATSGGRTVLALRGFATEMALSDLIFLNENPHKSSIRLPRIDRRLR
jgi:hypothetical protein